MTVRRIISGGQTGADEAALRAAKALGLETGGWMPKGFRTHNGDRPDFAERFGMQADSSRDYPPRTRLNVLAADGTVIFGVIQSPGCRLTRRLCEYYLKPWWHIGQPWPLVDRAGFAAWLERNSIGTLNVAGNREHTNPGIGRFVYEFLVKELQ